MPVRPTSHREQQFDRCCGNCKHCHVVEFKGDPLCFHGDDATIRPSTLRDYWSEVEMEGRSVGLMEGEEYSEVWGGRVVEAACDVCDSWEPIEPTGT